MYSKVIAVGRLVAKPELRLDNNQNPFTFITLAITKKQGEKEYVSYPSFQAFGDIAKNICKYKDKGELILVEGKLKTYTDKENMTQQGIVINAVTFLPTNKNNEEEAEQKPDWIKRWNRSY